MRKKLGVYRRKDKFLRLLKGGDAALERLLRKFGEHRFSDILRLSVANRDCTDEGMYHIAQLPLLGLDLSYTSITDDGLQCLGWFPELHDLSLEGCDIGDGAFDHIANLRQLRILKAGLTRLGDEAVARIAGLPGLRGLDLSQTDVSHTGLCELEQCAALEVLELVEAMNVTDDAMSAISRISTLHDLQVDYVPITDAGVGSLRNMPLRSFSCSGAQLGPRGFAEIGTMTRLAQLYLSCTSLDDSGLEQLKPLGKLNSLCISRTNVTDQGLRSVRDLPALTALQLSFNDIGDNGIKELESITTLQTLLLQGTNVTDACASFIAQLGMLEAIDLDQTSVGDRVADALAELPNLQKVYINGTCITANGFLALARSSTIKHVQVCEGQFDDSVVKRFDALRPACNVVVVSESESIGTL